VRTLPGMCGQVSLDDTGSRMNDEPLDLILSIICKERCKSQVAHSGT